MGNREPQIDAVSLNGKLEARRHNADHGVLLVIQSDGAADDGGVATEAALPEAVTENDGDLAIAGPIFFVAEGAAKRRGDTEVRKKVRETTALRMLSGAAPPV